MMTTTSITVYPSFGNTYKVTLDVPDDKDDKEFIDMWISENLNYVDHWDFWV